MSTVANEYSREDRGSNHGNVSSSSLLASIQVERPCRCGARRSQALCSQDSVLCQARCSRSRPCGRHMCKRRCCDGSCPPCEHPCSRTLSCRNHKCPSRCHAGPCYLCTHTAIAKCACGGTQLRLPCGAKRPGRGKLSADQTPDLGAGILQETIATLTIMFLLFRRLADQTHGRIVNVVLFLYDQTADLRAGIL